MEEDGAGGDLKPGSQGDSQDEVPMEEGGLQEESGGASRDKRKKGEETSGDEATEEGVKGGADGDAAAAGAKDEGGGGDGDGGEDDEGNSDVLRCMIYGFRQWDNHKQVSKWLANNNIKYNKLKRIPYTNVAVLRFSTIAERDEAMEKIRKALYKGETLFTKISREDVGTQVRRQHQDGQGQRQGGNGEERKSGGGGDGEEGGGWNRKKKAKVVEGGEEGGSQQESKKKKTLLEVVTPLFGTPYEDQLTQKQESMRTDCVEKLCREIKHAYRQRIRQRQQTGEGAFVAMTDSVKQGAAAVRLEKIRPAPDIVAYRNKCEFTVGRGANGEATVGFRLSGFEEGVTVESPQECSNVNDQTKRVAAAFQRYVRASSLPVYDIVNNTGVWRLLTVRTSTRTKQCLLVLCVSVGKLEEEGAWKAEEERLRKWITSRKESGLSPADDAKGEEAVVDDSGEAKSGEDGSWLGVTSLFVQFFEGRSNPSANDPLTHVWGKSYLEEDLLGLRFRISPTAFFQTSTSAAEVLYGVVSEWCSNYLGNTGQQAPPSETEGGEAETAAVATGGEDVQQTEGEQGGEKKEEEQKDVGGKGEEEVAVQQQQQQQEKSVLLDVCCGTGTIGICCAVKSSTKVKAVLGIEMCAGAVEDARVNAKVNSVENAAFVCSKAEDILVSTLAPGRFCPSEPDPNDLREVLQHAVKNGAPVLAVVDPPRDGLHNDCLKAIRNCESIKRLIYVSCNPTGSLVRDGLLLCSAPSKRILGAAFRPIAAIPVDMFPQTPHCECVMIFERE